MAKKTKKPKTQKAAPAKPVLMRTQRSALAKIQSRRQLATLVVNLAKKWGSEEQRALKRSGLERDSVDALQRLASELALASHGKRNAHLSELEGWPVCWSETRRSSVKPEDLLATPITVDALAVTCTRCKKAAELPSPEETAAFNRAEIKAHQARPKRTRGASETPRESKPRGKRCLTLSADLPVRLRVKGVEAKGVLKPDGTLRVKRASYPSPHAAARALAGDKVSYRIDGFQAWRYQDADGAWRMLKDHA